MIGSQAGLQAPHGSLSTYFSCHSRQKYPTDHLLSYRRDLEGTACDFTEATVRARSLRWAIRGVRPQTKATKQSDGGKARRGVRASSRTRKDVMDVSQRLP